MTLQTAYSEANQRYLNRTKNSEVRHKAAQQFMPGGVTRFTTFHRPYPVTIIRAEGPELHDADGNRYLDFINNYGSLIHGHAHPTIVRLVQAAVESASAVSASIPEQMELAQLLCERVASVEQIRFCNSGTEATMFAIRAARAFTGKSGFIKMEGGYHGLHDAVEFSISPPLVTGERNSSLEPIPTSSGISHNLARDIYIAPFNNIPAIETILLEKAHEIAAIIVEPVMGVAGIIPPLPGYLSELRRLADKYGVLLIFDEVQTLRLHPGGAQGLYHVEADLTAMAKIIGGGFPVGAFGGRADIMSVFDPNQPGHVSHGGTFSGNNITMTAGIASMQMLDKEAIDRLEALSSRLEKGMNHVIKKYGIPATLTRVGSMLNVHFTKLPPIDYTTAHASSKELGTLVHLELMNCGIFASPRGTWYLSTAMADSHIDETISGFSEVMQKISRVI
ncbi:UNVERIFIED_CONTAM: glutamate-1-semialdehyde 2,1-aminomutase [Brevibacillus sp. OAP136]